MILQVGQRWRWARGALIELTSVPSNSDTTASYEIPTTGRNISTGTERTWYFGTGFNDWEYLEGQDKPKE